MQKEIFEQPAVIGDTLQALINPATRSVHLPELPFALGDIGKITMIACGTALSRRHRRQILARTDRPHPGRGRHRLGVPLPRAGDAARRRGDRHFAIGRDRRHAGGAALLPRGRAEDHRGRQPAGKLDRARGRHRAADPGRPRDRRRLDQGVHDAARRPGRVHGRDGAGARHDRRRRRGGARRPAGRDPVARQRGPAPRRADPARSPPRSRRPATCSISAAARPTRWRSKAR